MADLIIREPLASWIREKAQQAERSVEDLLEAYFAPLAPQVSPKPTPPHPEYPPEYAPDYPPRPRESLTDDLIAVPDDIADKEGYREAARKLRPKLYEKARAYWRKVGDAEKLALTDEQLDQTFWLFDHEGVPRFLSEKAIYTPPPDPFEDLIGAIDTDIADLSVTVGESVDDYFRNKYGDSD